MSDIVEVRLIIYPLLIKGCGIPELRTEILLTSFSLHLFYATGLLSNCRTALLHQILTCRGHSEYSLHLRNEMR